MNLNNTESLKDPEASASLSLPAIPTFIADTIASLSGSWLWGFISGALQEYKHEGWDGYDAARVADHATLQAKDFVLSLPFVTTLPEVSAGYDGSIGLAWHAAEMTMFAHFPPTGMMDFTYDLPRFGWRHSKRLAANDKSLLEEIRPTLGYIMPETVTIVATTYITVALYPTLPTTVSNT